MRTMVAIPCMDMVHTDFMRSVIAMRLEGEVQFTFAQASLVYDGRNNLAEKAIAGGFDRVLWLDSDMLLTPDLFKRLHARLDEGREICSALYFSRKTPIRPVLYEKCGLERVENGPQGAEGLMPVAEPLWDYPEDSVVQAAACGFGAVMMTTALLERVKNAYGLPFSPAMGFGEDLSFCMRCTELGVPIWCDTGLKLGHVGTCVYDEAYYKAVSKRQ